MKAAKQFKKFSIKLASCTQLCAIANLIPRLRSIVKFERLHVILVALPYLLVPTFVVMGRESPPFREYGREDPRRPPPRPAQPRPPQPPPPNPPPRPSRSQTGESRYGSDHSQEETSPPSQGSLSRLQNYRSRDTSSRVSQGYGGPQPGYGPSSEYEEDYPSDPMRRPGSSTGAVARDSSRYPGYTVPSSASQTQRRPRSQDREYYQPSTISSGPARSTYSQTSSQRSDPRSRGNAGASFPGSSTGRSQSISAPLGVLCTHGRAEEV